MRGNGEHIEEDAVDQLDAAPLVLPQEATPALGVEPPQVMQGLITIKERWGHAGAMHAWVCCCIQHMIRV